MAASINHEAVTRSPVAEKIIAINPDVRLSDVIIFGICLFMVFSIVNKEVE